MAASQKRISSRNCSSVRGSHESLGPEPAGDVADLNVHADPEIFLASLAGCEAVASSSLHGLIFAEALRVPNVWIELSGKVHGGGFKFRDWFSLAERAERNTRKVMKRFHLAQGGSAHIRIADGLKSIQHRTGDACRIAISGRAISDGKKRDERVRRR
jgi:hypothetical protein